METPMPQENDYVENTFEPTSETTKEAYGDMTIEEALKPEEEGADSLDDIPQESDYGSLDEIKDFDLAFDDLE